MILRRFEISEDIGAPAARVWDVLLDFAAWPEWNPFIERVEGRLEEGATIYLHVRLGRSKRARQPERLDVMRQGEALVWSTKMVHPWLFAATRRQTVEPLGGNRSRYHSVEVMTGPVAALTEFFYGDDLRRGFAAMAAGLRRRAEG